MDTETLFHKFRQIKHLMHPRGHRGRPGGDRPGNKFGPETHSHTADPTRGQGRILAALKLQDAVPTKDLAFILGMRVASLNELLVKLERADLITRQPAAEDKRVILIHLTEAGRSTEQFRQERPDAFGSLNEEEREQLGAYLDRIIEHLESQREAAGSEEEPDEDFERWSEQARSRMGDERFEHWMSRMAEYAPDGYAGRFGRGHGGRFGRGRGQFGHGHGGHTDDDTRRHHRGHEGQRPFDHGHDGHRDHGHRDHGGRGGHFRHLHN